MTQICEFHTPNVSKHSQSQKCIYCVLFLINVQKQAKTHQSVYVGTVDTRGGVSDWREH